MGTHPIFESDFDCLTVQRMIFVYFLLQIVAIDAFGLINIFNMKGHGVPSDAFVEDIPQLNAKYEPGYDFASQLRSDEHAHDEQQLQQWNATIQELMHELNYFKTMRFDP